MTQEVLLQLGLKQAKATVDFKINKCIFKKNI